MNFFDFLRILLISGSTLLSFGKAKAIFKYTTFLVDECKFFNESPPYSQRGEKTIKISINNLY